MSESEFKKIRLHLRLLTVCVVVLIALLTANLVHRNFSPKSTDFPRVQVINGKNGKDASIDYNKVNQLIQDQLASLPKPQNGVNGANGQQGQSGLQGIPGSTGTTGAQGTAGTNGASGTNGENGVDGLTLQVQVNPITCQLQDKYTISAFWITIAQLPFPCEAQ